MAEIVLVHGIAQEQSSADTLERDWIPDLAGGVRTAGHPELADRIGRSGSAGQPIETRMAFYGDLFLAGGQQGSDSPPLAPDELEIALALCEEWLENAADRATDAQEKSVAAAGLAAQRQQMQNTQGFGAAAGVVVRTADLKWFAPFGVGFAERFVWRALKQVSLYLNDPQTRERAIERVLELISDETRAIVGHSLGSVVAYEAARRLERPLPLLMTLGSPLGLKNIVYRKLLDQPPGFPRHVKRWVNVADRDDFVAAVPNIGPLFASDMPDGAAFDAPPLVDNGAKPHNAAFYLTKAAVGEAIGQAFS